MLFLYLSKSHVEYFVFKFVGAIQIVKMKGSFIFRGTAVSLLKYVPRLVRKRGNAHVHVTKRIPSQTSHQKIQKKKEIIDWK